jgi:ketosteroid isomerase-like protein
MSKASDEAQIRALIEAWARAVRAKDTDGVRSHAVADIVIFDLAPPLASTGVDINGPQAWFSTWRGPIGYEIRDLQITTGDEAAFCHCLSRLSGTNVDGEKVDVWFRQTFCFRKIEGGWKTAHQHESVPFYMDGSYRAAIDLAP